VLRDVGEGESCGNAHTLRVSAVYGLSDLREPNCPYLLHTFSIAVNVRKGNLIALPLLQRVASLAVPLRLGL
jgi:hypothetical protein